MSGSRVEQGVRSMKQHTRALRVVAGGGKEITGEQILQEGARLLGAYLTRQLVLLRRDDPDYALIAAEASRFARLGDWRSPQMRDGSPV